MLLADDVHGAPRPAGTLRESANGRSRPFVDDVSIRADHADTQNTRPARGTCYIRSSPNEFEERMSRYAALFITSILLLAACSSDDEVADPTPVLDAGIDGASEDDLCTALAAATPSTGECSGSTDCGVGGLCVGGQCQELCLPETCGSTCASGTVCAPAIDSSGGEARQDLNGDGTAELLGACIEQAEGSRQAFETCGASGACASGLICIGFESGEDGTCFPGCVEDCDVINGFMSECTPTSTAGNVCVIRCDPADPSAGCPDEMSCRVLAQGAAVCAR